jgi:ParB family chromosome partitioning protein
MSSQSIAEAMRNNRAESLARRSPGVPGAEAGPSRRMEGLKNFKAACEIDVDRIIPDADQPRKEFDEEALGRLAASLKARGQLQPIRVRWSPEADHYVVVVGERRWRAARVAGMHSIACVVVAGDPSPEDLLEDQLVENALREGLKPVEQARAYQALMEARGLSQRDLADRLQIDHSSITRALGLLALPDSVQAHVDSGAIPASSAYAIASKIDDPAEQAEVAARVMVEGLSRAETVEVVRQVAESRPPAQAIGAGGGKSKSRGAKARSKPVTSRVFKTEPGIRITAERSRGIEPTALVVALREAAARVEAEIGTTGEQTAA